MRMKSNDNSWRFLFIRCQSTRKNWQKTKKCKASQIVFRQTMLSPSYCAEKEMTVKKNWFFGVGKKNKMIFWSWSAATFCLKSLCLFRFTTKTRIIGRKRFRLLYIHRSALFRFLIYYLRPLQIQDVATFLFVIPDDRGLVFRTAYGQTPFTSHGK